MEKEGLYSSTGKSISNTGILSDEISGIRPIEFSDLEDDQTEEIQEFIKENIRVAEEIADGIEHKTSPILKSAGKKQETSEEVIKITMEDIEEEIQYWNTAMVCYVLGANPPVAMLEGFFRRMWKEKVESVGSPKHGIFVVRFKDVEPRDEILNGGYIFFHRRPVL